MFKRPTPSATRAEYSPPPPPPKTTNSQQYVGTSSQQYVGTSSQQYVGTSSQQYVGTSSRTDRDRELPPRQYRQTDPQQLVGSSSRTGRDTLSPRRHVQPDFQYAVGSSSRPSNERTENSNNDIIIAVMGPTGAGKSTLINNVLGTGRRQSQVGHSLDSCTRDVQAFECFNPKGNRIVLVDSPGFNDTNVSDIDVLQSIADWLKESYQEGKLLSGLLFLHRISDNRMAGSPLRLLDIFKSICGEDAFQNVVLVTTMWDDVPYDVGQMRERELVATDRYWKTMISLGSRTARSMNNPESAWDIISMFRPEFRRAVLLQTELVDEHRVLSDTSAGRSFFGWLTGIIETLREILLALRKRLQRLKQADPDLQADIDRRQRVLDGANVMISRYTYPPQPRPRVQRASTMDLPNIMLEVPARSTTPESMTISSLGSNASVSTYSEDGPASSPDDDLAFDRTNRRALQSSVTALRIIHQLVGSSPIRGLQMVVATILKIAELIERIDCTDDSLVSLYQNTCSMTSSIIEVAQSGISGSIEAVVDFFISELQQIKSILRHLLERGPPHMISLTDQDRMAVDDCNRRLVSAYSRIDMPTSISHGRVRMEERLGSAIMTLRNHSLPNLRRAPTYP